MLNVSTAAYGFLTMRGLDMNFYPRHLGDYARDAGYLSQSEHGAYTLLLDWYYANERPIPADLVYDIAKATTRSEKQAAEKVLRRFFLWDGKVWSHKRVEAELAKLREKSVKARDSAKVRWMRTHSERNADAMLSNNQYPIAKTATVSALPSVSAVAVIRR